jgi:hypothetical protein
MKVSNFAGTATGEILDFLILNKLASAGVGKLVKAAGETSVVAKFLAEGSVSRAVTTSATVGFVNGAVLTPVQPGESSLRRLGNGLVDSASFAALGGAGARYAGKFGDNILGRAGVNAISGVAGGITNSLLEPLSHGRAPELAQVVENTAAWTIGGVVAGEAMNVGSNGLSLTVKQVTRIARVGDSEGKMDAVQGSPASLPVPDAEASSAKTGRNTRSMDDSAVARGMTLIDGGKPGLFDKIRELSAIGAHCYEGSCPNFVPSRN